MSMQFSNELELPPIAKQPGAAIAPTPASDRGSIVAGGLQMEFAFELPKGYLDSDGNLHRKGIMRLAKAIDEIVPMRDPRVQSNPAYATVIILSRVITQLGALGAVSPLVIEGLFACDLDYLQTFYRHINELDGHKPAIA